MIGQTLEDPEDLEDLEGPVSRSAMTSIFRACDQGVSGG